jgi:hypothetical protein
MNFDGTSWFQGPNVNTTSNLTVFAVVMMSAQVLLNSRIVSLATPTKVDYDTYAEVIGLHQGYGTRAWLYTGRNTQPPTGGTYSFVSVGDDSTLLNVPYIATAIYGGKGSTESLVVNGSVKGTVSTTGAFGYTSYGIGNYANAPRASEPFTGKISEVIVFNTAVTEAQRQQVEGYLSKKWKIPLSYSIPSSVPLFSPSPPIISNTATNQPSVFFPPGAQMGSILNSALGAPTPVSKSFIAVYQCPTLASAMNIGIGSNISGGSFGICQSNNTLYSPYQYAIGDLSYSVANYMATNYAFASFDASTNVISGTPGFNDLSMQAVAYQNKACNTPFYLGSSSALYTSSGFHLCEFIATSDAITPSDRQEVEGYLADKWGLSAQLPTFHPYKNFQPSGDQWIPPSLPTTISGLVSWLDMTYPGQTTTNISDRVSGSFTINIGTRNRFQLSNINNLPSLYFPGNDSNYLTKNSLPPTAEGSVLFVFNIADTRSPLPILAWGANTGNAPWGPILRYEPPNLILQNNYAGASGKDTAMVTLPMSTGTNLVFLAWDYTNFYLSVNGGTPVVGSNAIPGSAQKMYIGANVTAGDIPTMNFGELVVYNQYFEQSERQLLEGYLAWKWSLANKLPIGHPFYSQSPIEATVSESSPLNIPAKIPSLTTWLDAADSSTITGTTSVTQWRDKSATSDVFSGSGDNPKYSNTPNSGPSLPGVYFEGSNALRGTVNAAIGTGVGTCFMVATVVTNAQVFMGGFVSGTPSTGNSFGLMCLNKTDITVPLQSDARTNRNPVPGTVDANATVLFARMNATASPAVGEGSFGFADPSNVLSVVKNQSVSWQPSVPSASPWNLGYIGTNQARQQFYLHEFMCFSEYFTDGQRFVVEGYLAWKWGIQSQLPIGHPYKNTRPVAGPGKLLPDFSPYSIPGLQLWLDAADSATITGTTVVTAWKDKSANGYIATQSPVSVGSITRSTQNNLNVVVIDNRTMRIPSFSWSTFTTMFFVVKTNNWFYSCGTAEVGYLGYFLTGNWSLFYRRAFGGVIDSVNSLGVNIIPSSTQWCILSIGYGGRTQAENYCVNGTPRATTLCNPVGDSTDVTLLSINGRWDTTYQYTPNGMIAEILHYNSSITTSQRQQVETYLAQKWGLIDNLPTGHPGKVLPPFTTPNGISGCQLWLDAADSATITGTTSVTAWRDKSVNGYSFTNASYSAGTITLSSLNSKSTINLGTNVMTTSSFPWTTWNTIFFVVSADTWMYSSALVLTGLQAYFYTANWQLIFNFNIFEDANIARETGILYGLGLLNKYCIISVGYGGGTQASNYAVNGTVRYTTSGISSGNGTITPGTEIPQSTLTTAPLWLNGGSTYNYGTSQVAEIIHYDNELTNSQRQQVEGYLAWKWGLQSSLPSTHPYSKFAP